MNKYITFNKPFEKNKYKIICQLSTVLPNEINKKKPIYNHFMCVQIIVF